MGQEKLEGFVLINATRVVGAFALAYDGSAGEEGVHRQIEAGVIPGESCVMGRQSPGVSRIAQRKHGDGGGGILPGRIIQFRIDDDFSVAPGNGQQAGIAQMDGLGGGA